MQMKDRQAPTDLCGLVQISLNLELREMTF